MVVLHSIWPLVFNNSIILQWGAKALDTRTYTFPIAFTTNYSITSTVHCVDKPNGIKTVCTQGSSLTSITFYGAGSGSGYDWMAVGF